MIELLVVVFATAVLLAMLMPAVQSARESARRLQCKANLRQIGVAFHNYMAAHGVLPAMLGGSGFSPFVAASPYLDQANLFNCFNFSHLQFSHENLTARVQRVGVYVCPSDFSGARIPDGCWMSYAGNTGWGCQFKGRFDGLFVGPPGTAVSPSSVTDGAASTALVSEWVHGSGVQGSWDRLSATFLGNEELWKPSLFDAAMQDCENLDPTKATATVSKGRDWTDGNPGLSLYSHNIRINGRTCNHGPVQWASWTAGSRHSGGANALFLDGHVAFIRETIDTETWRAIGTRDGGEIVTEHLPF